MAGRNTGVAEQCTAADEPKYSLANLQRHCLKLFGVSTPTFAGATAGIETREYTINEMKCIIEKWRRQEVK